MRRRHFLALAGGTALTGCVGGDSADDGQIELPFEVRSEDAIRNGDGELEIRYRPGAYEAFQWEDTPPNTFYEADEGHVYLVVQLQLSATGRAIDVAPAQYVRAYVDGEEFDFVVQPGEIRVDDPIEPGTSENGWLAWEVPASASTVTLGHEFDGIGDRTYDTRFVEDGSLDSDVRPYSP